MAEPPRASPRLLQAKRAIQWGQGASPEQSGGTAMPIKRLCTKRLSAKLAWAELHWADRSAAVLAGGVAALMTGGCLLACYAVGSLSFWRFDASLLTWSLCAILMLIVPFWAVLRTCDLLWRGGQRALGSLRAKKGRRRNYHAGMRAQMS
jgi:hypothetical protein